jgi:hypothetical protein
MSDTEPVAATLSKMLLEMGRQGHAAHAIWAAATLDDTLGSLLAIYMSNLSNRLREKLFTGYGPLSSFSAKIDIAYSLNLITANLRRDLHIFREIRNEFAHSTVMLHFQTDEMETFLTKFSDYDPKMDRLAFYREKLNRCFDELRPAMGTLALAAALRRHKPDKADTSREKSQ